jgi:hypothetical protein
MKVTLQVVSYWRSGADPSHRMCDKQKKLVRKMPLLRETEDSAKSQSSVSGPTRTSGGCSDVSAAE